MAPAGTLNMGLLEGGWVQLVDPLPGWEGFTVDLRADLVNGEPRLTGLRLEPRDGTPKRDAVLTANRLRTFPATALAAPVYHWSYLTPATLTELLDALKGSGEALESSRPVRKGGARVTTAEAVAALYKKAQVRGSGKGTRRQAPRAAVCEALHVSPRTADRYIAEARRRRILAPYDDRKGQES